MKNFHNERGSALIIFYILMVALVSFGAILLALSTTDSRSAERQKRTMQALYAAEAGIERASYDLRTDYLSSADWTDGSINGNSFTANTSSFVDLSYTGTSLNGGAYTVYLKNVSGSNDHIWIKSVGTVGDVTQTIQVYAKMLNVSPWGNAIFAGAGASGSAIGGNVNIRGSVHILGNGIDPTDLVVNLGGTSELIGNNYSGLAASLSAKVPVLPTTQVNGITVSTLNAALRVKRGIVGLSGSATAGELNNDSNTIKETIDASYVTNGFGGNQGSLNVNSDNGYTNGYDLGDAVTFPSLANPYGGYASYQAYLKANALVINDTAFPGSLAKLAAVTPTSSAFNYSGAKGSITKDASGNLTISGIVYVEGGGLVMNVQGSNKTISYTGSGSLLVENNVDINVNLVTAGNNSFPNNIMAIMTPNTIQFDNANIDVMGLFYGESQIIAQKQTDIVGSIVSNYFNMGINVPSVYQVPETKNHLPAGLIGSSSGLFLKVVSWQKI